MFRGEIVRASRVRVQGGVRPAAGSRKAVAGERTVVVTRQAPTRDPRAGMRPIRRGPNRFYGECHFRLKCVITGYFVQESRDNTSTVCGVRERIVLVTRQASTRDQRAGTAPNLDFHLRLKTAAPGSISNFGGLQKAQGRSWMWST